ncbi:MAG TPA: FtsX-like permease family protein [Ktedonobacterales bacterium]|nr:FtsX-like permease family protein [Ktedonobacterales bacterium]
MNSVFEFSPDSVAKPLAIATALVALLLMWQATRTPHLLRIGLRNVPRRKLRTALVVFGLMLATTFVASAIAIDDTIVLAVKSVAVYNLGRIDEQVVRRGSTAPFSAAFGDEVREALASNGHVAGIAPALTLSNVLVADETARQVRGGVTALAVDDVGAGPLTAFSDTNTGSTISLSTLRDNQLLLNRSIAQLLNAHTGDTIYLYSDRWPGSRYTFTVAGAVTGGLLGDAPTILLTMPALSNVMRVSNAVNVVYIANTGNGLSGVGYSDSIADTLRDTLPGFLAVHTVKADGVALSLRAQDVFGRILTLFTLFAFAIGLLLIFLIFSLLAAERRAELGMARAVGMRRSHVVIMLLFEGATYDVTAAVLGIAAGLGLGVLIVALVSPIIARLGFPLQFNVQPGGTVTAFCLGALFTLATILLAAWNISRMTVASALRDLPEPPAPHPGSITLAREAFASLTPSRAPSGNRLLLWGWLLESTLTTGIVPFIVGILLLRSAVGSFDGLLFALGLSVLAIGVALLLRWTILAAIALLARWRSPATVARTMNRATERSDRLTALALGGGLALYWSLPFDALQSLGIPRFTGGIPLVFVAGMMMVFGAVIALAPNLDLLLKPVSWLLTQGGRLRHVTSVALLYPAFHRFRTGIGLALFSLVCFTMIVMACIAASTTKNYDNVPQQASGYDIAGQPLFQPVGGVNALSQDLRARASATFDAMDAISSATPVPLGVIQPGAPNAGWRVYPASQIDGAFLDGTGLPLAARAQGYASDADVWHAIKTHPGDVVIDASALSPADLSVLGLGTPAPVSASQFLGPPLAAGLPGLSSLEALNQPTTSVTVEGGFSAIALLASDPALVSQYHTNLRDIALGPGIIAPTTLWVGDLRGQSVSKVRVIGVVNNVHSQIYGMLGSPATFAPIERGLQPFGNEYFYFGVRPGVDAHSEALALGSALLENGFETTVLQDVLLSVSGPQIFISRVLVGLVGLTLLVGMAALAVTGSRAVVERRQQIGMLRALGFRRSHVQVMFFIESLLIGVVGAGLGLALGLILCRNLFAVDFFAAITTNLTLVVPWRELALICGAAIAASALAALLPAWQAGRIAPADALRYE